MNFLASSIAFSKNHQAQLVVDYPAGGSSSLTSVKVFTAPSAACKTYTHQNVTFNSHTLQRYYIEMVLKNGFFSSKRKRITQVTDLENTIRSYLSLLIGVAPACVSQGTDYEAHTA
jgi:hypothetical protein